MAANDNASSAQTAANQLLSMNYLLADNADGTCRLSSLHPAGQSGLKESVIGVFPREQVKTAFIALLDMLSRCEDTDAAEDSTTKQSEATLATHKLLADGGKFASDLASLQQALPSARDIDEVPSMMSRLTDAERNRVNTFLAGLCEGYKEACDFLDFTVRNKLYDEDSELYSRFDILASPLRGDGEPGVGGDATSHCWRAMHDASQTSLDYLQGDGAEKGKLRDEGIISAMLRIQNPRETLRELAMWADKHSDKQYDRYVLRAVEAMSKRTANAVRKLERFVSCPTGEIGKAGSCGTAFAGSSSSFTASTAPQMAA